MKGPVQVLVVGLDDPTYSGEVIAELSRLKDAGIVRLVDLLVVAHHEDGTLESVTHEMVPAGFGELVTGVLAVPAEDTQATQAGAVQQTAEEPPGEDVFAGVATWSLDDAIPAGQTAAVALVEHVWAAPLRDAIVRNGGRPLDETWLAPTDVARLDELVRIRASGT